MCRANINDCDFITIIIVNLQNTKDLILEFHERLKRGEKRDSIIAEWTPEGGAQSSPCSSSSGVRLPEPAFQSHRAQLWNFE